MLKRDRIVIGISGRGISLCNLLENQELYNYKICGVFSSSPYAAGLKYAYDVGLPTLVLNFTTPNVVKELTGWLAKSDIEGIVLAGFTRHFPNIAGFAQRTVSIHPSLLPAFGGKGMFGRNVHKAVFAAGCQQTGATVHLVTEEYDEGRIISQITVNIADCDSVDAVQKKVLAAEHLLYPRTLEFLIDNDWRELPPLQYEAREDGSCVLLEEQYEMCS